MMLEIVTRRRVSRLAAGVVVLLCSATLAWPLFGQTVYRWTDERGTVHFSDMPPSGKQKYEVRDLPTADEDAPEPTEEQAAAPEAESGEAAPTPAADEAPAAPAAPSGPALVVLTGHESTTVAPTHRSFRGEVENKGGETARDVFVTLRVIEVTQGDECLDEEIDVDPPTLAPGEKGRFQADFGNPCFLGEANAELNVYWR